MRERFWPSYSCQTNTLSHFTCKTAAFVWGQTLRLTVWRGLLWDDCWPLTRECFSSAGHPSSFSAGGLPCGAAFIQTAPSVFVARSTELNTCRKKSVWNDIHQSRFVSIRDQVNLVLSFTVSQLWELGGWHSSASLDDRCHLQKYFRDGNFIFEQEWRLKQIF